MGNFIDLTGHKYGSLTVIKRIENRYGRVYWSCMCDCGNVHESSGKNLRNGEVSTCGKCPTNTWEFKDGYVIGYTQKGEKFYIDKEDYEEVSKYTWCKSSEGYIISSNVNGRKMKMHRFVMKAKKDELVDHAYQKKYDNRKSKLRICTNQENNMNRINVKGYTFNKKDNIYIAQIKFNRKQMYIGSYKTSEEARLAYCTKALELFGEFAHYSVKEDYERLNKKLKNNSKKN
jgi:hypothetical protein